MGARVGLAAGMVEDPVLRRAFGDGVIDAVGERTQGDGGGAGD